MLKSRTGKLALYALPVMFGLLGWAFVPSRSQPQLPAKIRPAQAAKPNFLPRQHPESSFLLGGIQINEADNRDWVQTLQNIGMNTVEVTVYARQGRWNENNLWYAEEEPGVVDEIRTAKAAGMRVVLVLRVLLDHAFGENKFLWHGMVFPESEYLLQNWFDRYRRFARKWARIAEQEQVDVLVLGSEMNALAATRQASTLPDLLEYYLNPKKQERYRRRVMRFKEVLQEKDLWVRGYGNYPDPDSYLDDEIGANQQWAKKVAFADSADQLRAINVRRATLNWYWEGLVDQMREEYRGKMTFAANFDNYHEVGFWKKLDFMGINAYFPLRDLRLEIADPARFSAELKLGWREVLSDISAFKIEEGISEMPVLFTELGYSDRAGSTVMPWQAHGFSIVEDPLRDSLIIWAEQRAEPLERALAVNALHEVVQENAFPLAGILYWKLTTHDYHLPYEPFALHIAEPATDSLQNSLLRFLNLEPAAWTDPQGDGN